MSLLLLSLGLLVIGWYYSTLSNTLTVQIVEWQVATAINTKSDVFQVRSPLGKSIWPQLPLSSSVVSRYKDYVFVIQMGVLLG